MKLGVLTHAATICALLLLPALAAQEGGMEIETTPSTAANPRFPASFDESQFRKCLGDLSDPANVMAIKFGYFVRRVQHPFPRESALALLEESAKAETVGSERWYAIQSLYAFAAFRMQGQACQRAYDAYDAIFTRAVENPVERTAHTAFILDAAREYVSVVPMDHMSGAFSKGYGGMAAPILVKAYECWLRQPDGIKFELPLRASLKGINISDAIREVTARYMAEPEVAESFYPLLRAAIGVRFCSAEDSLNYLKKAERFLSDQNKEDQRSFFMVYADDLDLLGKKSEEADLLRRCIAATGQGRDRLARVAYAQGDMEACRRVLAELRSPDALESEIVAVAESLSRLVDDADRANPRKKEVDPDIIAMIQAYLARPGNRDVRTELRVRQVGATLLARHDRRDEALAILEIAHLAPRIDGHLLEVEKGNVQYLQAWIQGKAK